MANPMFNDTAVSRVSGGTAVLDRPAGSHATTTTAGPAPFDGTLSIAPGRTMTIGGTCAAAGVMLAVLLLAARVGWGLVEVTTDETGSVDAQVKSPGWLMAGLLIGFGLAILTAFKPPVARFTALPYAIAEGLVLGMISHLFEARFEGIVVQAVIATAGVVAVMLALYGLRVLRATPRFVKGVVAATLGVLAVYAVSFVASLFGADLGIWSSSGTLGLLVSLVVVTVAALNLILDFDFIERGTAAGLPRYMDWYGAFGLMVTIVWLYLELLRLLSRLNSR